MQTAKDVTMATSNLTTFRRATRGDCPLTDAADDTPPMVDDLERSCTEHALPGVSDRRLPTMGDERVLLPPL